jgi:hypothetical protein
MASLTAGQAGHKRDIGGTCPGPIPGQAGHVSIDMSRLSRRGSVSVVSITEDCLWKVQPERLQ